MSSKPESQEPDADVIVVGAGMAGLAAACELAARARRVLVIEARPRTGGRVHTLHAWGWPLPVELGAEFVDVPGPAWDVLREAGVAVVRSTGGLWEIDAGVARPLDLEALGGLLERLDPDAPDRPFAQWLDDQKDLNATARRRLRRFVEGFHAAELERVGTAWLARAMSGAGGGGDARHTALSGYARVADAMRADLRGRADVRLGTVATDIAWDEDGVAIGVRSGEGEALPTIRARAAIITLPPSLLRDDGRERAALRFHPALPEKHAAGRAITVGSVLKVLLRFQDSFWEEHIAFDEDESDGPPGERKLFMGDAPFPTWWTSSPVISPVLTGWAGGGAAARVHELGEPVSVAIDSLAGLLRVERSTVEEALLDTQMHDWDADPFSRGAYSWAPAGALPAHERLAEPVEGILFFAGEATAEPGQNGTVDGAIRTGRRAAREVLERMGAGQSGD